MQESPDIKSFRTNHISSSKQSVYFGGISRSLIVSQSQSKALERYFYRRESTAGNKIEMLNLKKLKGQKMGSFHENPSKSAKNTFNTNGNQDQKDTQITFELTNFKQDAFVSTKQHKEEEENQIKFSKVYRRTSDWTLIYNRNSQASSKPKKQEFSDIKIKINSKVKQKLSIASNSNMQLILKKHKADNVKEIQQKMRSAVSRGGNYDSQRIVSIKQYNRKCGYSEDTKIFIWNSEDQHIRRVLLSWGWVQNVATQSPFFHLKWTYTTHFNQCQIKQRQFINHFKNSQQMTSKSYLTKNLRQNQSSFGKIDAYYPKCFDIGNQSEWIYFMDEYRHNVMLVLLKRIYELFCSKRNKQMSNFDLFYQYHFSRDLYGGNSSDSRKRTSAFRKKEFRQILMEDYKNRDPDFIIQINLITDVLRYWRYFRKNKQQYEDKGYHFLHFNSITFISNFTQLQKYAFFEDLSKPRSENNFTKELFSTPSLIVLERISKQYQFCKFTDNLFQSYGLNSLWIVKPTSNSRGSGIYLTTDFNEIQTSSKGIQSRLVQKYIERPLLIKNKKWSPLYMRKFDIRQWVLLKSLQPLEIYMFSECYLRLCHDSYDEKQPSELYRHLTNYSINKLRFKNKQDSVLPLSYLKEVLQSQFQIDWTKTIRPQMESIIIKSLKSCIDNFDDCNGNCFELFGYDMLIDESFKVWLLEINMSPACQQRTNWLTDYLQDMTAGMLKIVLPDILLPKTININNYKWDLVLKEETSFKKKDVEQNLEIIGTGIKLNDEWKIDNYLVEQKMARKIQRFFKSFLPRYKQYKQNKAKNENILNAYLKSFNNRICFQQKRDIFKRNTIQYYIKTLLSFKDFSKIKKQQNIGVVQKYYASIIQAHQYQNDLSSYRKKVVIQLAHNLKIIKHTKLFCKEILQVHQKVIPIQTLIRQFLKYRTGQKRKFQKYFQSVLECQKYEIIKKRKLQAQAVSRISIYINSIKQHQQFKERALVARRKQIEQYVKSLLLRRQYYHNRFQIFFSLVGRVLRVARRRCRCNHFAVILGGWKQQIEKEKQQLLQKQSRRLRQIMQTVKQKQNSKPIDQQRVLKPGSIRHNRKS